MNQQDVINHLFSIADSSRLDKMKRFGIDTTLAIGISVTDLRKFSRKIGRDHELALSLWNTTIHEARMLAALIDDPKQVGKQQMDTWIEDVHSWDLCDHCCYTLFDKTEFACQKIREWSNRRAEFVKRAAFSLIAALATHDKKAKDALFEQFFPIIIRESTDERKYVKKAVNWALRNIGKRNHYLNEKALETAQNMLKKNDKTSQWIAKDAIKELRSEKVQKRISRKISSKP